MAEDKTNEELGEEQSIKEIYVKYADFRMKGYPPVKAAEAALQSSVSRATVLHLEKGYKRGRDLK